MGFAMSAEAATGGKLPILNDASICDDAVPMPTDVKILNKLTEYSGLANAIVSANAESLSTKKQKRRAFVFPVHRSHGLLLLAACKKKKGGGLFFRVNPNPNQS